MLASFKAVAESVGALSLAGSRAFHTSQPVAAGAKHMKRINRLHKHWAKEMLRPQADYVDPMMGKPQVPFLERVRASITQGFNQVDGLASEETSQLLYGAEQALKLRSEGQLPELVNETEKRKREILGRIIALNNSNQQQFQKQAVAFAVSEFQRFPGDTGSSEVQAAILTIRIQFLAAHAKETKKDLQAKRKLEHWVQTRRNILLYLKRENPERYVWAIEKLGLSDEAVNAEFHMSARYLWQTQFYGDRTLPLKKTRKDTRDQRKLDQKKQKALRYLAHNNPDMTV